MSDNTTTNNDIMLSHGPDDITTTSSNALLSVDTKDIFAGPINGELSTNHDITNDIDIPISTSQSCSVFHNDTVQNDYPISMLFSVLSTCC